MISVCLLNHKCERVRVEKVIGKGVVLGLGRVMGLVYVLDWMDLEGVMNPPLEVGLDGVEGQRGGGGFESNGGCGCNDLCGSFC